MMETVHELSTHCRSIQSYQHVMDHVPITNIGRACVCIYFTMTVLKNHPKLLWGTLRYWTMRIWQRYK